MNDGGCFFWVKLALLLFPISLLAAEIPDRINVQKFQTQFEIQKKASDAARTRSDGKNAEYGKKKRDRIALENEKTAANSQIEIDQRSIGDYNRRVGELEAQVRTWKTQVSTNENEIAALKVKLEGLSQSIADKRNEVTAQDAVTRRSSDSRSAAETELRRAQARLSEIGGQLRNETQEKDRLGGELDRFFAESQRLLIELDETKAERITIRDQIGHLRHTLEDLERDLTQAKRTKMELEADRKPIDKTVNDLRVEIARFKDLIDALNKQISEKDKLTTQLDKDLAAANAQAAKLTEELTQLDAEKKQLNDRKRKLEADNQTLRAQSEQKTQNLGRLETAKTELVGQRPALAKEVADLDKTIREQQTEIDRLNGLIASIDQKLSQAKAQTKELSTQIQKLSDQLSALDIEIPKAERRQADLESQIPNLKSQITEKDANIQPARDAKAKIEQNIATLSKEAATITTGELATVKSKIAALNVELGPTAQQIQKAKTELATLQGEKRRHETQLPLVTAAAAQALALEKAAAEKVADASQRIQNKTARVALIQTRIDEIKQILDRKPPEAEEKRLREELKTIRKQREDIEEDIKKIQRVEVPALAKALQVAANARIAAEANRDQTSRALQAVIAALAPKEKLIADLEASVASKREELNRLAARQKELEVRLAEITSSVKLEQTALTQATQALSALEASLTQMRATLAALENELKSLPGKLQDLRATRSTADARKKELEKSKSVLEIQIAGFDTERSGSIALRDPLVTSQAQNRTKLTTASASLKRLDDETAELGRQIAALTKDLDGIKAQLASNETEITQTIPARLQLNATKTETAQTNKLVAVESARGLTEARKTLVDERRSLLVERDRDTADQTLQKQALVRPLEDLARIDQRLGILHAEIDKKTELLGHSKGKISQLRKMDVLASNQIQVLVAEGFGSIERDMDRAKGALELALDRVKQFRDLEVEWQKITSDRNGTFERADRDYQAQVAILKTATDQLESLRSDERQASSQREGLVAENGRLNTRIIDAETERGRALNAVALLETGITNLRARVAKLEQNIATAFDIEKIALGAYQLADEEAKAEETKTASAREQLRIVVAQYQKERALAQADGKQHAGAHGGKEGDERGTLDGSTRGDANGLEDGRETGERNGKRRDYEAGVEIGKTKGSAAADAKGTEDGQIAGTKGGYDKGYSLGLTKGYEKGRGEGRELGYREGYDSGNNEENRQRGNADGRTAGTKRATDTAMKEELPRGRQSAEQKILASAPKHKVEIDNSTEEENETPMGGMTLHEPSRGFDRVAALHRALRVNRAATSPQNVNNADGARTSNEERTADTQSASLGAHPLATLIAATLLTNVNLDGRSSGKLVLDEEGVPVTDYRHRSYRITTQPYEHPDFDTAYKLAYDSAYEAGYHENYSAKFISKYEDSYTGKYTSAMNEALAIEYKEEKDRGESDGHKAAYDAAYPVARKRAYDKAFAEAKIKGEEAGLPVRYNEGYGTGRKEGFEQGKIAGSDVAYQAGYKLGEEKGFGDAIAVERQRAFSRGEEEMIASYQNSYKLKGLEAQLIDSDGDGKFKPGDKVVLKLIARNFGGLPSESGKFSVEVEDVGKTIQFPTNKALLKVLAGDTEGTYLNVLTGNVIGNASKPDIKLNVKLLEEKNPISTMVFEAKIEAFIETALTAGEAYQYARKFVVGRGGSWWSGNYAWIQNQSSKPLSGLEMKVVSKDAKVRVYQDWMPVGTIQPGKWGYSEIWLSLTSDVAEAVFEVSVRDHAQKLIHREAYKVPIEIH